MKKALLIFLLVLLLCVIVLICLVGPNFEALFGATTPAPSPSTPSPPSPSIPSSPLTLSDAHLFF